MKCEKIIQVGFELWKPDFLRVLCVSLWAYQGCKKGASTVRSGQENRDGQRWNIFMRSSQDS